MREIKFRAWNKKTNEMITYFNPVLHAEQSIFHFSDTVKLFRDYILMQFIGLCDKNGVEIWEGDIVKINMGRPSYDIKEVQWGGHWNYAGFGLHGKRAPWAPLDVMQKFKKEYIEPEYTWDALNPETAKDCEVIGNIHEAKKCCDKS